MCLSMFATQLSLTWIHLTRVSQVLQKFHLEESIIFVDLAIPDECTFQDPFSQNCLEALWLQEGCTMNGNIEILEEQASNETIANIG